MWGSATRSEVTRGGSSADARIIDRTYVLHEQLGAGGMGAVYRATHRLSNEDVALKIVGGETELTVPGDTESRKKRLLALAIEFQTLASLHHPNIIRVLDYGFDPAAGPYFTMELLDRPRTITEEAIGQPMAERIATLGQLLHALSYLHRRGIVHRDLKPSNVLCDQGVVKVADFGVATHTTTTPSEVAGTGEFIAPEIWLGAAPSVASDLYAFGVIAHEVLMGATPFNNWGRFARALATTAQGAPRGRFEADLQPLSGPLGEVVARLLAREPSLRHESADAVVRELANTTTAGLALETVATRESFLRASEFVGRDEELGALLQSLAGAREGKGGGFLIGGESGVGKSRLTAELRTRALVGNVCVVGGKATPEGGGVHELWVPVLKALALRADLGDAEVASLSALIPELPGLLGRRASPAARLQGPASPARLRSAIESLFRVQLRPTLVLLEDLQWASTDSLELLSHLAELAKTLPVLFVGNYRDDEATELAARLPSLSLLQLRRLEKKDVARLAVSMLGERGESPDLVEFLFRETEGNVFFLVEVVRELAEKAGALGRIAEMELPAAVTTGGIARIAWQRVDRVPPASRGALELAATLGRELDLAVLKRLDPGLALERWLVECADAAVIERRGTEWHFAHDKLREAILAQIPRTARQALHERVAGALVAAYGASDSKSALIAYHFQEAGDDANAAAYSARAGARATRMCSYGEARSHFGGALAALERLPVTDETRRAKVDLLLQQIYTTLVAESAEQNFRRAGEARALLDELAAAGPLTSEDQGRVARLDYFHGRIYFYRGENKKALEYYRRVLAVDPSDEELIALPSSLVGAAVLMQGDATQAEPLLARAIAPLERLGEPFEWFRAVGYHGLSLIALGSYEAGVAELDRVCARAAEIAQPNLLSAAHLMTGSTYLFSGDWPLVIEHLRQVVDHASTTGDKLHLSLAWSGTGWAYSHLGRHDEAEECRKRAMRIADALGGRLMLNDWFRAGDAEIALNAGDWPRAITLAEEVATMTAAAGQLFSNGVAERVWGEALAKGADHVAADRHMEASIRAHARGGIVVQIARTRLRWAIQMLDRGEREKAEALYAQACADFERFRCVYALAECRREWEA